MAVFPPASHSHDPGTSHEAEHTINRTGTRGLHCLQVLELVRRYPRYTAIELWHAASAAVRASLKEPQEVRRRLTDLHHKWCVQQEPARRCRVRGTRMVTWSALL